MAERTTAPTTEEELPRGVSMRVRADGTVRYRARTNVGRVTRTLGTFNSAEEARDAYAARASELLIERLLAQVEISAELNARTGTHCWLWTGSRDRNGYGRVGIEGRRRPTHRAIYELLVGPIAPGLVPDHLCVTPLCCNPDHLDPVTRAENNRRAAAMRTHCKRNHEFTAGNLIVRRDGSRTCRTCVVERERNRSRLRVR